MLSDTIKGYYPSTVRRDFVAQFGGPDDGVIEFPGLVDGGVIEVGYFYGQEKPKNIVDISTQVGCPSKCSFCELGDQPFTRNLTPTEMFDQVILMLQTAKLHGIDIDAINHKVVFAKSGEPSLNPRLVEGIERISTLGTSFKVSTVFPHGGQHILQQVARFASGYNEPVQLQVSLISTSEEYRQKTAGIRVATFGEIRETAEYWRAANPHGRKINLSLILSQDNPVRVEEVYAVFPPELFRFRFRPYVPTQNGAHHDLGSLLMGQYSDIKKSFEDKGYDVGDWAKPTPTEQRFGLASNVTLRRYLSMIHGR